MPLHDLQKLDDDFRGRADEDLSLAGLFGVVDRLEGVVQDGGADHFCGGCGQLGYAWKMSGQWEVRFSRQRVA